MGTNLSFGSAYHPQIDGQIVVVNRSLGNLLRSLTKEYFQTWDHIIPQAEYAYNDSTNRSTGRSPFEVVYSLHPRGILDLKDVDKLAGDSGYANDFSLSMKEIHDSIK